MIAILAEAAHAHEAGGGVWADFLDLMTDPAHIAFEFAMDGVAAALLYPVGRWAIRQILRRHDEEVHSDDLAHHDPH